MQNSEQINLSLREHQLELSDWLLHGMIKALHEWTERFILEFKLQTPIPAIGIDHLQKNTYGHFRLGRNGFGLQQEIIINIRYLDNRPFWETLGTMLHELIHSEQFCQRTDGKKCYHNNAFIRRAAEFGLIVNRKGNHTYKPPPNPFFDLLAKYDINVEFTPQKEEIPPMLESEGPETKLKLWICSCKPQPFRVRVARENFKARCLICNEMFRKQ